MQGTVTVTVSCPEVIGSAKVLPSSWKITPIIQGKSLSLTLSEPKPLTIEVNGNWVRSLHLFANPPEAQAPKPGDPNVVFFGPGIHEVSHLVVTNNQTVYVAGGAIVRAVIGAGSPSRSAAIAGCAPTLPLSCSEGPILLFGAEGLWMGAVAQLTPGIWSRCRARTSPWKA